MSTRTGIGVLWMMLMGVLPATAATISGVGDRYQRRGRSWPRGWWSATWRRARRSSSRPVTTAGTRWRRRRPGRIWSASRARAFRRPSQTVIVERADQALDVPLRLEVGTVAAAVVVTASRAERDTRQIPLHVDTITKAAVEQTNQLSTGDALTLAANITPVGNGPFGVRPRLRGLDSTRLLVLVDGERLNTARQATDRTGAEVGLVSPDAISRMEVVNGAGTLMYGSDALAGTINIITNEAAFTPAGPVALRLQRASTARTRTACAARARWASPSPRFTVRVQAGAEDYDNYQAGDLDVEDTRPLFASGVLDQADTIDDNFGFSVQRVSRSVQCAVRAHRQRGAQLAGARQLRQRVGQHQAGRAPLGARALPAAPDGGHRLSGLRRAVLLQRDVAAAQQSRSRVGALRGAGGDAVAGQPVDDRLLPAHRTAAAEHAAGAVSGADAERVLPDQRDAARHPVGDRAAGVDARRRSAGGVRARVEAPAHDRPHVLPGSQQRSPHHDDHDLDGGAGGAGAARPGAGGLSVTRCSWARRRRPTPSACRTRASGTSRCSRRTNGGCGPNLSLVAGLRGDFFNVTTEATPGLRRRRRSSRARGRRSIRRRCPTPTAPPTRGSR